MRRARYPHWALRHLVVSAVNITKYCAVAVVTALPALHTLNWTGRTQYLEEQRKYIIGYPDARLLRRLKTMCVSIHPLRVGASRLLMSKLAHGRPPVTILSMAHVGS
ncbi:hypothetical protein HYPSUDRAFT_36278, partial [Hypholoma sublateritium FD-334 SS-4]